MNKVNEFFNSFLNLIKGALLIDAVAPESVKKSSTVSKKSPTVSKRSTSKIYDKPTYDNTTQTTQSFKSGKYSDEETKIITEAINNHTSIDDLSKSLNRSVKSLKAKIKRISSTAL
jgi:hypothetical protein